MGVAAAVESILEGMIPCDGDTAEFPGAEDHSCGGFRALRIQQAPRLEILGQLSSAEALKVCVDVRGGGLLLKVVKNEEGKPVPEVRCPGIDSHVQQVGRYQDQCGAIPGGGWAGGVSELGSPKIVEANHGFGGRPGIRHTWRADDSLDERRGCSELRG